MSLGDSPQSRESRHACRNQIELGCKQKKSSKKVQFENFWIFFWPRSLARLPPSSPESLTATGSATCEIITDQPGQSTVLSYQSLARYRLLGFDKLSVWTVAPIPNNVNGPRSHTFIANRSMVAFYMHKKRRNYRNNVVMRDSCWANWPGFRGRRTRLRSLNNSWVQTNRPPTRDSEKKKADRRVTYHMPTHINSPNYLNAHQRLETMSITQ